MNSVAPILSSIVSPRRLPPIASAAAPKPPRLRWNFAEWFILSQTFIPALLYLPGSQVFRIPIRMASYGISLAALFYWWNRMAGPSRQKIESHPAAPWLKAVMIYLCVMLLHPTTNSALGGVAQIAIYLSVLAPIFWAPYFVKELERLERLLWLVLICSGVNSFVGVMQVRNPEVWMPSQFSSVILDNDFGLDAASYIGSSGQTIIRPPGLLDTPGAVAGPAVFALYLGLVFVSADKAWWKRLGAATTATLGAAAIFLTLVRSSFLIGAGMVIVYLLVQVRRGQIVQAAVLLGVAVAAISIAFLQSAQVGGESITSRFQTILADDPLSFYYDNRGNQIAATFATVLPEYPFGAGLGRWGMINNYFGDPTNGAASPIWVEIQVPAWIVDGGIVLLLLYPIALGVALWHQLRLTFHHSDQRVRTLAGIIFAANAGLVALCFSYPVFVSGAGIQFWFLSGALYGVAKMPARRSVLLPALKPPPFTATALARSQARLRGQGAI